ncbi:DUF58 domain-containing protein [bacterium]|nr:DUF58 domain-containing protein [bacterium]
MSVTSNVYPNARAVEALASHYQLVLPERQRAARMGESAGRRAGSSIEFQDRKDYTLGDDLRHIDWRAFARTDRLSVKLYREEICPTVEIVIDASDRWRRRRRRRRAGWTWPTWWSSWRCGCPRRCEAGRWGRSPAALVRARGVGPARAPLRGPAAPAPPRPRPQARHQGVCFGLSFPADPARLVHAFAAADRLVLIQVLPRSRRSRPRSGRRDWRTRKAARRSPGRWTFRPCRATCRG